MNDQSDIIEITNRFGVMTRTAQGSQCRSRIKTGSQVQEFATQGFKLFHARPDQLKRRAKLCVTPGDNVKKRLQKKKEPEIQFHMLRLVKISGV